MIFNTPYASYNVRLEFSKYAHGGRTALRLVDATDGEPILVATVNIPDAPLAENEIMIKNWSENEGVLQFLQENGIVGPILRYVPTGFCQAQVVKLLRKHG